MKTTHKMATTAEKGRGGREGGRNPIPTHYEILRSFLSTGCKVTCACGKSWLKATPQKAGWSIGGHILQNLLKGNP